MLIIIFLLSAILVVLIATDKSPRQLCYNLIRESWKGLNKAGCAMPRLRLWLMDHDPKRVFKSPYANVSLNAQNSQEISREPKHKPVLLNLPTSDRYHSGEATHPDVLHVPEGWGEGQWTWLMAETPYPLGTDFFENPEFLVSYDGLNWSVPEGLTNPLAIIKLEREKGIISEFHSDPSLLLAPDGCLFYYFRRTIVRRANFERCKGCKNTCLICRARARTETENSLFLMCSNDGVHWTEPEMILTEREVTGRDKKFLSPSALYLDGRFLLWTVEYCFDDGTRSRCIVRRESHDGRHWGNPVRASITLKLPEDNIKFNPPWHLDVVKDPREQNILRIALTTAIERGYEAELFLGTGDRDGLAWEIQGRPFVPAYHFEARRIYRSSLVPMPSSDSETRLYYSALSANGTWGIAMATLRHEQEV